MPEKAIPAPKEVEKFLVDAVSQPAWWLWLKVASTLGPRPSEVCTLRVEGFDFEERRCGPSAARTSSACGEVHEESVVTPDASVAWVLEITRLDDEPDVAPSEPA